MEVFGGNWTTVVLLVFTASVLVGLCFYLHCESLRLRRANCQLGDPQPPRATRPAASWLPITAAASFLLPCAAVFATAPFLALLGSHQAAAQFAFLARVPIPGLPSIPRETPADHEPAAVAGASILPANGCDSLHPGLVRRYVETVAQREGLSPDLLQAVIFRESSFRPCAVSTSGALGLMQLLPGTAADLGVEDPFNPGENIDAGARFLSSLMVRYQGDVELALAAYHAGPTTVDNHGTVPPYPKTHIYIRDILNMAGLR
jgi:soluble lytic murein transglycosylase-like protein